MKLTKTEQDLLMRIINDKYSVGAFAGMIFNAYLGSGKSIDELVGLALRVRLRMMELIEDE